MGKRLLLPKDENGNVASILGALFLNFVIV